MGFLLPEQPFLQGVLAGEVEVAMFLLPGDCVLVAGVPRFREGVPAESGLVQQPLLPGGHPAGLPPDALVSLPVAEGEPAGCLVPVRDAQVAAPGLEGHQGLVAGGPRVRAADWDAGLFQEGDLASGELPAVAGEVL